MFRVQEKGGGALYKDVFKPEIPANLPEAFDRFVIADVWEIDMDRALVSMGDRAKLIHGLPLTEIEFGLATFLSAYRSEQATRIAELLDHAITAGAPFSYVAELVDRRKGPVMGIGEIAGNKLKGAFFAVCFATRHYAARTRQ